MSDKANIIPLHPDDRPDDYLAGRRRLTQRLIQHGLIESFFNFSSNGKPYPFVQPDQVLPDSARRGVEFGQQNAVLVMLIEGRLPPPLNKHFRLRNSNRISWRNIQRLAPSLDLSDFKATDCRSDAEGFERLLTQLLPLDYALVAETAGGRGQSAPAPVELTHLHVKVERLTDNAIKDLAKQLGYIERRLFERGEDYVEALETKFLEYYGFSANASGRKSAAAMSAQLLARYSQRFCVFVAGQEDCRLTLLDERDAVTEYFLIRLDGAQRTAFTRRLSNTPFELGDYAVSGIKDGPQVVVLRVRLPRTEAGRPSDERRADKELLMPWLEIGEQAIVPLPGRAADAIPFAWATG
jgi:hypothetical protein